MEIGLSLESLKNFKEIRFTPELNHTIYKNSKDMMVDLVEDSDILKKIYDHLSPDQIRRIFLDSGEFLSTVKASDVLEAICEMNAVDFTDGEMKALDKSQHHGKKAKMDIQKEKELQIKDLEGPTVTGVSGPAR